MDNKDEKINKLKEMIIKSKMELIRTKIPKGACPYSKYKPYKNREIDCTLGCEKCRIIFLQDAEKSVRKKIESL